MYDVYGVVYTSLYKSLARKTSIKEVKTFTNSITPPFKETRKHVIHVTLYHLCTVDIRYILYSLINIDVRYKLFKLCKYRCFFYTI